jgi:hypothetical protein
MRRFLLLIPPFVLLACGPSLDEGGCPVDKPGNGASCDSEGKICEYEELDGSNPNCDDQVVYAFRCEAGVWVDYGGDRQCPASLPENGSDCLGYHDSHDCGDFCGGNGPVAQCGSETDYLWEVSGTCP